MSVMPVVAMLVMVGQRSRIASLGYDCVWGCLRAAPSELFAATALQARTPLERNACLSYFKACLLAGTLAASRRQTYVRLLMLQVLNVSVGDERSFLCLALIVFNLLHRGESFYVSRQF
eukprot:TRINITY_DN75716_c0_g1_i1.p1 TRINITY_DN75716_c0_g1~~TRINITY_DN75716_c0_g1_i1.p1  ORF type:complete len:119 (-),score=8.66 TRINITY_DN75716_c0_g1_i1:66-422(-)